MLVLHVVILIGVILTVNTSFLLSEYLIFIILLLEYIFYGISTYTLSFVYAVETLSERGFSLVMIIYWITISSITISFTFISDNEKDTLSVFGWYIGFGVVIVALVLLV
jgi:hypothetical protein